MTKIHNRTGRTARQKGNRFELDIIKKLKEIGYVNCKSTRSESRNLDANNIDIIDLDNKLPCNIQCKCTQNTPNYYAIKDGCNVKDKPFVVIWKKVGEEGHISPGTLAMIDLNYFLQLLKLEYDRI